MTPFTVTDNTGNFVYDPKVHGNIDSNGNSYTNEDGLIVYQTENGTIKASPDAKVTINGNSTSCSGEVCITQR